jgi:hypothetical protein
MGRLYLPLLLKIKTEMASGSQSMSNRLVIHEPSMWKLIFFGHDITHASLTIIHLSVWLTRLSNHCQQAQQDM